MYRYLKHKEESGKKQNIENDSKYFEDGSPYIQSIILLRKDGHVVSTKKNVNMEISSDMMKEEWYVQALKNSMPI